jgi:uncharacterized membrane protein
LGWGGWGAWSGIGLIGLILNVVLFAGVLAVLGGGTVWLARQLSRGASDPKRGADPLGVARRRLAAGEITVAEFEEIRSRLQP